MSHARRRMACCPDASHRRCRSGTSGARRSGTLLISAFIVVAGLAACSSSRTVTTATHPRPMSSPRPLAARTQPLAAASMVLTSSAPDEVAVGVARQLIRSAPVVVVSTSDPAALAAAVRAAQAAYAPLLLTAAVPGAAEGTTPGAVPSPAGPPVPAGPPTPDPEPGDAEPAPSAPAEPTAPMPPAQAPVPPGAISPALRAEITNLRPRDVLAVGLAPGALAAALPGVHVVTASAALPRTTAPAQLSHVAVLVPRGDAATTIAATTTAQVAGAAVVPVRGVDPRADPAAIAALSAVKPSQVLAVGASFGPADLLAYRVSVAATGVQLPGGGQVVFPGHRLVALYGHPGVSGLGALGQQDLTASIARAKQIAAEYQPLSSVPVIPAFEIIATVALGSPGPDGTYSAVSSVASLRPWVQAATAAGLYVVLDLQPGRANLLTQAKMYEPLLALPNVGLALDAEWKLQPGQVPLRQIGSVSISEVNSVVSWLAGLTGELHLPQKVLVLHQFRLSMITDEGALDTGHSDLAIVVHMDGQGTQGVKQETWNAITAAAPPGVFFGWKNFFTKDHPMATPQQTMIHVPAPVMVSYQ